MNCWFRKPRIMGNSQRLRHRSDAEPKQNESPHAAAGGAVAQDTLNSVALTYCSRWRHKSGPSANWQLFQYFTAIPVFIWRPARLYLSPELISPWRTETLHLCQITSSPQIQSSKVPQFNLMVVICIPCDGEVLESVSGGCRPQRAFDLIAEKIWTSPLLQWGAAAAPVFTDLSCSSDSLSSSVRLRPGIFKKWINCWTGEDLSRSPSTMSNLAFYLCVNPRLKVFLFCPSTEMWLLTQKRKNSADSDKHGWHERISGFPPGGWLQHRS